VRRILGSKREEVRVGGEYLYSRERQEKEEENISS
jgi:hypothetical protein